MLILTNEKTFFFLTLLTGLFHKYCSVSCDIDFDKHDKNCVLLGFFNASFIRSQAPGSWAPHSWPLSRRSQNPDSKARALQSHFSNSFFFPPYVHLRQAIEQVCGCLFATTAVKARMNHYTENYFSFSVCVPDLDSFAVHRYRCHGNGRMVFLLISLHN